MFVVPPSLGVHGLVTVVGDEDGVRIVTGILLHQWLLIAKRSLRDLLSEQAEFAVLGRTVVQLLLLLISKFFY